MFKSYISKEKEKDLFKSCLKTNRLASSYNLAYHHSELHGQ